jgi:hypothetical protein
MSEVKNSKTSPKQEVLPPKNKGGRPRGALSATTREIRAIAQQHGAECIQFLMTVVRNAKATIDQRTVAAKEVLDRGYGKSAPPPQRRLGGGSYDFSRLTPEQVRQGYEIAKLMSPESMGDTD